MLRRHVRGQPLGGGVRTPLRETDVDAGGGQPLPEPVRQEVPAGLRELFESPERGEQVAARPQETAADQDQHGGSDEIVVPVRGSGHGAELGESLAELAALAGDPGEGGARTVVGVAGGPPSTSGKASAAARAASSASPSRPASASARASRALASPVR